MIRFLTKRIGSGLLVLISVVLLICSIIYLAPVDPTRLTFGQRSDNKTVLQKQKELGLDKPLSIQMLYYLRDLSPVTVTTKTTADMLHSKLWTIPIGEYRMCFKIPYLRDSYQTGRPVSSLLSEAIPRTMILALTSFLFAALLGIVFGVIAAVYKDSIADNLILVVSTLGISVPSYVAAIFCALLFGFILAPYTGLNMQGGLYEINDIGDDVVVWKNLILPTLALGMRPVSIVVQLSRSAMLDVLDANYIKTAKSKGLSYFSTIYKHAFRNAMNPIVTSLSGWLASLLAGAFFVEKVFNYKGVGELTINSLINYDIPVILACVLFISGVFVLINILTDVFYVMIDPKVKAE